MNTKHSSSQEERTPFFSFYLDNIMSEVDNDVFNIRDRINAYKNWKECVPVSSCIIIGGN